MTDERKRQILEAAAGVIAERGFCETRISDVAGRIGLSPALILYYFPSKDALLAQALAYRDRQFFDLVEAHMAGSTDPVEQLGRLISACCPPTEDLDRNDNEWQLWLETWARSRHDGVLAAERLRMDDALRSTIARIVEAGVRGGSMTCPDPGEFSTMFSSLLDGLAIQVLLQDPSVDGATMARICRDLAVRELSIPATDSIRLSSTAA
jgi:AcrR family transcriptional regulator